MRLIDADALIDRIKNPYEQAQVARWVNEQPTIEPEKRTDERTETHACDLIDRRAAIDALEALPSAQPPKEIPKRVLWSGWQGYRDTRYRCPLCKKLVRNDDVYCHRCGQHLMFPHISFTPYIPGQKQDVIVRWEDEG